MPRREQSEPVVRLTAPSGADEAARVVSEIEHAVGGTILLTVDGSVEALASVLERRPSAGRAGTRGTKRIDTDEFQLFRSRPTAARTPDGVSPNRCRNL